MEQGTPGLRRLSERHGRLRERAGAGDGAALGAVQGEGEVPRMGTMMIYARGNENDDDLRTGTEEFGNLVFMHINVVFAGEA